MATHYLKTWPEYFEEVVSGKKRYTARKCPVVVEYILKGGQFGLEEGNVIMSIRKMGTCL